MIDAARAEARLGRAVARDPLLGRLGLAARGAGWSVHVVGGWPRDKLLERRPRDADLVLGPRPGPALAWLAERSSHRTVTFDRRVVNHRLTIDGRLIDVVERGTRPIEDELARRDFTVNALGVDLVSRRLLDPCGGLGDLARGLLVLPQEDAIRRDPLRALRGVRLAAEIPQLELPDATLVRLGRDATGLAAIAPERVRDELERILLAPRPGPALERADGAGLLSVWLPELAATRGVAQSAPHHLDVFGHTLAAVDLAARPGRLVSGLLPRGWPDVPPEEDGPPRPDPDFARRVLLWSILLHDLGKPATREVRDDGRATFHGHETVGARMAGKIARRLTLSRRLSRAVVLLVQQHLRLVVTPEGLLSPRALSRIVRAVAPLTEVLAVHSLADQGAARAGSWRALRGGLRATVAALLERERELDRAARRGRLLTGRDVMERLGIREGPAIGTVLREVEELRDAGELVTRDDALDWLARRARRD